jgi:two-component system OmpR family sensor kinase
VSLRRRLILAAAYLLTIVVIALEFPLAITIDRRTMGDFKAGVLQNAAIVSAQLNDDVAALAGPIGAKDRTRRLSFIEGVVTDTARRTGARIVAVDSDGAILADSTGEAPVGTLYMTPSRPEFRLAVIDGQISTMRRPSQSLGQDLLVVTVPIVHNRGSIGAVRVSETLGEIQSRVHKTWIGLGIIGLAVILVGLLLAWVLATTLARPVRRLEEAAVRLGQGDLDARAEPEGPAEVATLARSFNQMARTLSANLTAQRDFLANASHQLRTPLTGLKLRLEAIEQEGGFAGDQAKKAGIEADRLNRLVDDLLELARASSAPSTGTRLDVAEIAAQAVDRWSGPAAEEGKRLACTAPPASATVWADAEDLGQVLDNLIDNSVRYSPGGTEIEVAASATEDTVSVTVSDTGPGIPEEDRARMFERFYRGSTGKRAGPGMGLGLAIVAELVRRWSGDIELLDGPGTRIRATFPRAPTNP